MCRVCWLLVVLLLVSTSTLMYPFIVRAVTLPVSDGRTAIQLDAGERDLVLAEMRDFLVALREIAAATVDGDVSAVNDAARRVGGAARSRVPASLAGKLPPRFKRLGFDTHAGFDTLADNTEAFGSTETVVADMASLLQNCTACHATYRIEVVQ